MWLKPNFLSKLRLGPDKILLEAWMCIGESGVFDNMILEINEKMPEELRKCVLDLVFKNNENAHGDI